MSRHNINILFFGLILASLPIFCLPAQSLPQASNWGPVTMARGGAAVAAANGLDSMTTNPAGLASFYGKRAFGGSYTRSHRDLLRWGVGLVDGNKNIIGGFNFDYASQGRRNRQGYTVGLAYATNYAIVGMSGNVYRFSGLTGENGWTFTQTAGVMVPVMFGITVGISGRAFLDKIDSDVEAPEMSMGVSYAKEKRMLLSFQADRRFDVPGQAWNYSVGGDVIFQEFFFLRSGYRFDNTEDSSFWSAGAGLKAPRFELSSYFTQTVEGKDSRGLGFELVSRF